jgi:hypothetical protein
MRMLIDIVVVSERLRKLSNEDLEYLRMKCRIR